MTKTENRAQKLIHSKMMPTIALDNKFSPPPLFLKNLKCRHNMLSHSIIVRNLACLKSQHVYFAAMLLCREQHFYLHEEKNPEI